ncbi:MAG: hypothetical protein ABR497_10970, partial [Kiritimatiellia bacterium]
LLHGLAPYSRKHFQRTWLVFQLPYGYQFQGFQIETLRENGCKLEMRCPIMTDSDFGESLVFIISMSDGRTASGNDQTG